VVERGAHGDGVGVVAVVDQGDSTGELDRLPAQAREDYPRRPRREVGRIGVQGDADGDRAEGIGQVVRLDEREEEAGLARRRADQSVGATALDGGRLGEDVAAGAEGDRPQGVVQVGLEGLGIGGDDRPPVAAEATEDLRLRLGDRLERAE
jgi:hypothetical protein